MKKKAYEGSKTPIKTATLVTVTPIPAENQGAVSRELQDISGGSLTYRSWIHWSSGIHFEFRMDGWRLQERTTKNATAGAGFPVKHETPRYGREDPTEEETEKNRNRRDIGIRNQEAKQS